MQHPPFRLLAVKIYLHFCKKVISVYNILKVQDSVQGYVSITVSEGIEQKTYTVKLDIYEQLGAPSRSDGITNLQLDEMRQADEYYRAKRAALSILSYGDNNARMLKSKLSMRSISSQTCDEIVSEMISLGYINELCQLERLISEDANRKLLGPRKTVPRLLAKGYKLSDIREVYDRLSHSGEIDIEKSKELLLQKYLGNDRCEEQVRRLLYKYGYDF